MAIQDTILYVDDEPVVSSYYEESLKLLSRTKKCQVVHFLKAQLAYDRALELTQHDRPGHCSIKAVIFDILMPPESSEKYFNNKNTQDGVKTGIVLYRKLREIPSLQKTPMFALTNLIDEDVLAEINREENLDVLSKFDYPPSELVNLVGSKI